MIILLNLFPNNKKEEKRSLLFEYFTKHLKFIIFGNISKWDEKFVADNKCTCCGQCSEVCPVENIKIENCHPIWQHHCERCLRCIQWCPTEAIQYGKKTVGIKRYHHPNVTVENFIETKD